MASPVSVSSCFAFASTSMIAYECRTIGSGDDRGVSG